MTIPVDTWLDAYLIPAVYESNGTIVPKRLNINFTGGLVATDDPQNASTDVSYSTPGTGQSSGVLPVVVTANSVALSSAQAAYQGLRLTGAPTGAVTVTYPTPTADANGATGGIVGIVNTTTQPATIAVNGGSHTETIPPKSGASMTIDVNGSYLTTTTAGPP